MSSEEAAGQVAVPADEQPGRRGRRRKVAAAVSVVVVIAVGAAAVVIIDPFRTSAPAAQHSAAAASTATVTQRSLSSQTPVNATLGYAHNYSVVVPSAGGGGQSSPSGPGSADAPGQSGGGTSPPGSSSGGGTFTWLPSPGKVIKQGHAIYDVDGSPVVLLYGSTPAYRAMSEGASGSDVQALNSDLAAMGYASKSALDPKSRYFGAATVTALQRLQGKLGVSKTGSLALGQAVFLPTAARVTSITATLGLPAQGGSPVLQASSTTRQVTAQLDATQQSDVAKGDEVTITLPNNQTTRGIVTSVGTVAAAPSNNGSGSSSGSSGSSSNSSGTSATIQVNIKPTDPKATGTLTQAPVQVMIITATVKQALVVPVDALLARASGGYAVEVVTTNSGRHLVPVTLGIFDDADGLVQVTSSQLAAGQSVVVPKI